MTQLKEAMNSRTVLSFLLILFVNMPSVKPFITQDLINAINPVLAFLGIMFRLDATKTLKDYINEVLSK